MLLQIALVGPLALRCIRGGIIAEQLGIRGRIIAGVRGV
jgi:hypothetical protein